MRLNTRLGFVTSKPGRRLNLYTSITNRPASNSKVAGSGTTAGTKPKLKFGSIGGQMSKGSRMGKRGGAGNWRIGTTRQICKSNTVDSKCIRCYLEQTLMLWQKELRKNLG